MILIISNNVVGVVVVDIFHLTYIVNCCYRRSTLVASVAWIVRFVFLVYSILLKYTRICVTLSICIFAVTHLSAKLM